MFACSRGPSIVPVDTTKVPVKSLGADGMNQRGSVRRSAGCGSSAGIVG